MLPMSVSPFSLSATLIPCADCRFWRICEGGERCTALGAGASGRFIERFGWVVANLEVDDIASVGCIRRWVVMDDGSQAFQMVTQVKMVASIPDRIGETGIEPTLAMKGQRTTALVEDKSPALIFVGTND
jgi:hypothetical protein